MTTALGITGPGSLYLSSDLRTTVEVWQGDLHATGPSEFIATMDRWFGLCTYAGVRPSRQNRVSPPMG